jgi:hypothetical protein
MPRPLSLPGLLSFCVVGFALGGLLLATPAPAQTVINQTKAKNGLGGCDGPGFPVVICSPGSYKLTSNLTVPDADTTAIQIPVPGVTLDLNGYSIVGPTVCSGTPTVCAPATGTGVGIDTGADNTTVINGAVRGMGMFGMRLQGYGNRVENVHASSNGYTGIFPGWGCIVANNTATANGVYGLFIGPGCRVTGNVVSGTGGEGAGGNGIVALSGSIIVGNTAFANRALGLSLGGFDGYSQNALTDNNGGNANQQVFDGVDGQQNVCGTDTVCP